MQYNHGFTLIEILVVLSLVGFLFVALFGSYLQVQDVVHNQSQYAHQGNKILSAAKILSDDISNTYYEKKNPDSFFSGKKEIFLQGRVDKLNLAVISSYSNPSLLQGKVFAVTYFGKLDQDNDTLSLYRKEDNWLDYDNPEQGIPIPLIQDIKEFSLEYSLNRTSWQNTWDLKNSKKIPKYVRATFRWLEGNTEREFVVIATPVLAQLNR